MRPFSYRHVASVDAAGAHVANTSFLAGGTTLLDLMKLDVMRPAHVVDINPLSKDLHYGRIEIGEKEIRLGALVHMGEAADHSELKSLYPVIAQSLELAASQQLRNMATLGGNVLQRTRCPYFRDVSWSACNKREAGSGCAAVAGFNRKHAILGTSDACVATYPGDFAQALIALDTTVELVGPDGPRMILFDTLHVQPGKSPDKETTLGDGELIVAFRIPRTSWSRRSTYVKVRDRKSYEFALASAAVALEMDGDNVKQARIALGGVATVPWRAKSAENSISNKHLDDKAAQLAADIAFSDARPLADNRFKVELGKATLVRALLQAKSIEA